MRTATAIFEERTERGLTEVTYANLREGQCITDSHARTAVSFGPDTVGITGYWDGNSGEWSEDWLGAAFDRSAVTDLRDKLTAWLEQTA